MTKSHVRGLSNVLIFTFPTTIFSGQQHVSMTPDDYEFQHGWVSVKGRTDVVFDVQACNDAHVALSSFSNLQNVMTYEVVLSGWSNQRSVIRARKQGENLVVAQTPGLLSCNESRTFWVSWTSGIIKVGRGAFVGVDRFMEWIDPLPKPITTLSVASGYGSPGTWKFRQQKGLFVQKMFPLQQPFKEG